MLSNFHLLWFDFRSCGARNIKLKGLIQYQLSYVTLLVFIFCCGDVLHQATFSFLFLYQGPMKELKSLHFFLWSPGPFFFVFFFTVNLIQTIAFLQDDPPNHGLLEDTDAMGGLDVNFVEDYLTFHPME